MHNPKHITPQIVYQQDIASGNISADPLQAIVIQHLEQIFHALTKPPQKIWPKLKNTPIKGLYLWGGVGIGKTYLMDLFYQALPFDNKMRMHFHHFMKKTHDELKQYEGEKNPLEKIAKKLAKQTKVLCFDEFFVNDIADAMILANLFAALFKQGITLLATSNVEPDNLYRNGLGRSKFLPAIALIKEHTLVHHVKIEKDYRLQYLKAAGVYFHPRSAENYQKMGHLFEQMTHTQVRNEQGLEVEGRTIEIINRSTNILWVAFNKLCAVPRSQMDYLYIAKNFHTIFLQDVSVIAPDDRNTITYFIHLIDIFYDASVKVIILADKPVQELYSTGYLHVEYQRTSSRLQEMQSEEYLRSAHLLLNHL